jgi:hypothetical protein
MVKDRDAQINITVGYMRRNKKIVETNHKGEYNSVDVA